MFSQKKAFTLVELLVVIAIIGLLATLSVIALSNARAKSRDTKRVADVKQIQTALELFFNDEGRYPTVTEWNSGLLFSVSDFGTTTYMAQIPTPPPVADGSCTGSGYNYTSNGDTYALSFCLGSNAGSASPGIKAATPEGLLDTFVCGATTVKYDGGPWDSTGTVRNMGGYYRTVMIGDQCWLRDNMNVGTRINTGPVVSNVGNTATSTPAATTTAIQKYCHDDLESDCDLYGGLYNWTTTMQLPWTCFDKVWNGSNTNIVCDGSAPPINSDNRQGICPLGWHIPSNTEQWQLGYLYSAEPKCPLLGGGNWCAPAGDYLKKAEDCSEIGNARCGASGYDLVFGGGRGHDGGFYYLGAAYYWNATQPSAHYAYNHDTSAGGNDTWWLNTNSTLWSWPVRCIKD